MKKWSLLLVALMFSGCAHTPTDKAKQDAPAVKRELSAAVVAESIIKGKTTRDEIVAMFGPPNVVEKNTLLPSKEMLAKLKGPLPPIARTVEFWRYWTVPPVFKSKEVVTTNSTGMVFRLMIFMDENGVALDYLTEERKVDLNQSQ
jgi:hypothetical protein